MLGDSSGAQTITLPPSPSEDYRPRRGLFAQQEKALNIKVHTEIPEPQKAGLNEESLNNLKLRVDHNQQIFIILVLGWVQWGLEEK